MSRRVWLWVTILTTSGLSTAAVPALPASSSIPLRPVSVELSRPVNQLIPSRSLPELSPAQSGWTGAEETLHWDLEPDRGVSINGTYSYGGAARFTATADLRVKAVLYYLTENADDIFVHVNGQGTNMEPGPELDTTRATGSGGNIWRRANMPLSPLMPRGQDFWTCVIVRRHPQGQHPLTLDLGPMVPYRGGYITLPDIGPTWYQLTDPPFWTDRNWDIRAVIEYETGVEDVLSPSDRVSRHRFWPSPVRDVAHITYSARRPGRVVLGIYDAAGRPVRKLLSDVAEPGERTLTWDRTRDNGRRVAGGTYLYRLTVDGTSVTGTVAVLD